MMYSAAKPVFIWEHKACDIDGNALFLFVLRLTFWRPHLMKGIFIFTEKLKSKAPFRQCWYDLKTEQKLSLIGIQLIQCLHENHLKMV